jgi:transaldolase / glucose-6-phosphate isomerase
VLSSDELDLYTDENNARDLREMAAHQTVASWLQAHFARAASGDYLALLAYIAHDENNIDSLQGIRLALRDKFQLATCAQFGPRFLHSTGQAYKGGPNSGVFLQLTCNDPEDIPVPGQKYTFGVVKAAQAQGDLDVLVERKRRALRVHMQDVESGLAEFARAVDQALS